MGYKYLSLISNLNLFYISTFDFQISNSQNLRPQLTHSTSSHPLLSIKTHHNLQKKPEPNMLNTGRRQANLAFGGHRGSSGTGPAETFQSTWTPLDTLATPLDSLLGLRGAVSEEERLEECYTIQDRG
jgi:hypothetical protein